MTIATRISSSAYFLWAILALPSIPIILALLGGGSRRHSAAEEGLEIAGIFSAFMLVIALAMSPLLSIFPKSRAVPWLIQRRRYFGIAAFSYAAGHVAFYFVDLASLTEALDEFLSPVILVGWLALFVFIPLAITSNSVATRLMGWRRWKLLQRGVYAAAVLVLAHWLLVEPEPVPYVLAAILVVLECCRVWRAIAARRSRARDPLAAA